VVRRWYASNTGSIVHSPCVRIIGPIFIKKKGKRLMTINGSCFCGSITLGMHIFVGSKASWETIPEGVSQHEEGPPVTKPESA
jgi:hypothetical protein